MIYGIKYGRQIKDRENRIVSTVKNSEKVIFFSQWFEFCRLTAVDRAGCSCWGGQATAREQAFQ